MTLSAYSQEFGNYRWKNRILLLCETGEDLTKSGKQIELFSAFRRDMEERQLLIFVFDGKQLRDTAMNVMRSDTNRALKPGFEGVLLIGKDGGIKWESQFFVEPEALFKIVDSMPMRRAEMNRKHIP